LINTSENRMANTYKWNIISMDAYPTLENYANVVSMVHWKCTATDDATPPHVACAYGMQGINFVAPTANDPFTPFEKLTEDMVISWLMPAIGDMMIPSIYNRLDNDIIRIQTPQPVTVSMPWVPPVTANTVSANTDTISVSSANTDTTNTTTSVANTANTAV